MSTESEVKGSVEGEERITIRYLSLFSGIGGFELALDRVFSQPIRTEEGKTIKVDLECVGYSEINPNCIKVYESNYPKHANLGSVDSIDGTKLEGMVDMVVGGPPCQDLTVANNFGGRAGLEGARSGLLIHYVRLLKETGAKWFIMENVARMAEGEKERITNMLREAVEGRENDRVWSTVLDSSFVSAQRRRRLFWTNFPLTEHKDRGVTLESVLLPVTEDLHRLEHSQLAVNYMDREVSGGRIKWSFAFHSDSRHPKSRTVTNAWHKGKPYNVLVDWRTSGKIESERVPMSLTAKEIKEGAIEASRDVAHPLIRNFSPEEAERLQTFPDGWTGAVCKTERFKQIGNAVTVEIVRDILKDFCSALAKNNSLIEEPITSISTSKRSGTELRERRSPTLCTSELTPRKKLKPLIPF